MKGHKQKAYEIVDLIDDDSLIDKQTMSVSSQVSFLNNKEAFMIKHFNHKGKIVKRVSIIKDYTLPRKERLLIMKTHSLIPVCDWSYDIKVAADIKLNPYPLLYWPGSKTITEMYYSKVLELLLLIRIYNGSSLSEDKILSYLNANNFNFNKVKSDILDKLIYFANFLDSKLYYLNKHYII